MGTKARRTAVNEIRRILTDRGREGINSRELYELVRVAVEQEHGGQYRWSDYEADLNHIVIARKVSKILQEA